VYFILKATLRTLLLPPAAPLLVTLLGWLIARRFRRLGALAMATGVVSLWLLSTGIVADALTRLVERLPALDLSKPIDAQAIVIIGGGGLRENAAEYAGPAADFLLLDRLNYGAFVARRTGLPVMVSGAPVEARVMRITLKRDYGIDVRWIEHESRDTFENARFSRRVLAPEGIDRIVLVTMSTHMWRATQEFTDAGFTVSAAPSGLSEERELAPIRFVPTASALSRSSAAVYELLGEPARRFQAFFHLREKLDPSTKILKISK
jgi:uncharacterized SAM-binding protein YcdF (DUF218 family)